MKIAYLKFIHTRRRCCKHALLLFKIRAGTLNYLPHIFAHRLHAPAWKKLQQHNKKKNAEEEVMRIHKPKTYAYMHNNAEIIIIYLELVRHHTHAEKHTRAKPASTSTARAPTISISGY